MTDNILRPIQESNLKDLYRWRNSPHIMARTRQWRQLTWKEHQNWFNNLDPNKNLMFGISHLNKMDQYLYIVGACGLTHIDWINRSAEVSIYIGNKKNERKGYGSKALTELKRIAFDSMNLHRIFAEIYSFNEQSMKFFEKNEFRLQGTVSETVWRFGCWYDSHYYNYYDSYWDDGRKK